jgi:hypothetical protein
MITFESDMSNVAGYIGAVDGILKAVEHPAYEGDFLGDLMGTVRDKFKADTIAAHKSGTERLAHVFEWPQQDARGVSLSMPSTIPLFRVTKKGRGSSGRVMSYYFVPSTQPVPLPDPDRYGFKAEKLSYMRRHTFKFKALIMETQSNVTIAPRFTKRLFIPDAKAKYGYYMTATPKTINPGGPGATGGFASWWSTWFQSRAAEIVAEKVKIGEDFIAATGRKVIRHAAGTKIGGRSVGGRFASGTAKEFEYVGMSSKRAEAEVLSAARKFYDEEEDW